MKKARILSIVLILTLVMTMLAGCVGSAGSEKTEAPAKEEAAAPAEEGAAAEEEEPAEEADTGSGEGGVINYSSMWTEAEPQALWLAKMAEDFEAETGTHVEINWVGRDVLNQVKTQMLAGNAPDLVEQVWGELYAALLADEELILPLDDLLAGPGPDGEATMKDAFLDYTGLCNKDGKVYEIPYNYISSGFYYNKTMWNEMGITPPETWDELVDLIDVFKDEDMALFAQDNESMYNCYWYYLACQRVMGKGHLAEAALDKTGETWDDPGFLEAAKLIEELAEKGAFQMGYDGTVWPAGQQDFALGNEGALLCGTWIPSELNTTVDEDWEWGFFPFPTVEGGVGKLTDMEGYFIGPVIPKDAKNVEGAKEFITFMSRKDNAQAFTEAFCMSAHADVALPEDLADVEPYVSGATDMFHIYDGVDFLAPQWNADVFYPYAADLLHGALSAEEFISGIKDATIAFYAKQS